MADKLNISYSIKAIDKFTKVHTKLSTQLKSLQAQIKSLSLDKTIDIDVDSGKAVAELATMEAMLKAMDNRKIKLDVDVDKLNKGLVKANTSAKRLSNAFNSNKFINKLKRVNVELRHIDDFEMDIDIEADKAINEITKLQNKIRKLKHEIDIDVEMSGIKKGTREFDELKRTMDRVDRMATKLDKKRTKIEVHASTKLAQMQLEAIEHSVKDLPSFKMIWIKVRDGTKKPFSELNRDIDKLADSLRNVGLVAQNIFLGPLVAMIPALAPMVSTLVGGVGALGAAMTSAGLAAGGYAAVAIPALKGVFNAQADIKDMNDAIANATTEEDRAEAVKALNEYMQTLNGTQRKTLSEMEKFKSFYTGFAKQFEKPVLNAFIKSMDSAKILLESLEPAIGKTADLVDDLFKSFNKELKSDSMKSFFNWINTSAVSYLEKLVKGAGDFIAGLGKTFQAFDPLGQGFVEWFAKMGAKFREWSEGLDKNKGFQKFVDYVMQSAPQVWDLFVALVKTISQLLVVMAPLGSKIMDVATAFFNWYTETLKTSKAFAVFNSFLPVFIGAFMTLVPTGILFVRVLKTMWPVLKTAGSLFMTFGKTILKVIPWVFRIGKTILGLSNPIGIIITAILLLVPVIISNWSTIKQWTITVFSAIGNFLASTWEWIKSAAVATVSFLGTFISGGFEGIKIAISTVLGWIVTFWTTVWTTIKTVGMTVLTAVWTFIKTVFTSIKTSIMNRLTAIAAFITTIMSAIKLTFSMISTAIKTKVVSVFNNIKTSISNRIDAMKTKITVVWTTIKSFVTVTLSKISSGVKNKFNEMKNAVTNKMASAKTAISNKWNSIKTGTVNAVAKVYSTVTSKFNSVKNSVTSKMNSMKTSITNKWNSIKTSITSKMSSIKSSVTSKLSSMVSSVANKVNSIKTKFTNAWNRIKTYLRGINLSNLGSNIIKGLIRGIGSMAGALIDKAKGVVKGAINAAKNLLKIGSPSKLFYQFGRWTGEGMINGLAQMESPVERAARRLAEATVKPFDNVGKDMQASINEGTNGLKFATSNFRTISRQSRNENKTNDNDSTNNNGGVNGKVLDKESAQPVQITLQLGSSDFTAFVDDITVNQERKKMLTRTFGGA